MGYQVDKGLSFGSLEILSVLSMIRLFIVGYIQGKIPVYTTCELGLPSNAIER